MIGTSCIRPAQHAASGRDAVGYNTLWDALDAYAPPEPLADPERVLYQAYAACFHWLHAGTVVNHGRGEYGIAWAALAAGRFERALVLPAIMSVCADSPGASAD